MAKLLPKVIPEHVIVLNDLSESAIINKKEINLAILPRNPVKSIQEFIDKLVNSRDFPIVDIQGKDNKIIFLKLVRSF